MELQALWLIITNNRKLYNENKKVALIIITFF
ncbi:Uncharacterised protein [Providencia rettgeri]|nr:hypothetical protein RB151_001450 [Providencia rettgeri]MCF8962874.1 hypothetical protein [Providencia rettgeri]CAB5572163.1 Uncharacterised protein [Providencia rettgeri]CAC9102981.1 Uncharacterised protein [Providencia rettgeri]